MTLMSHLLVAAVLDERGKAYWDCTAPVSFELKESFFSDVLKVSGRTFPPIGVTDISKILKKCTRQTDIFDHRSGDRTKFITLPRSRLYQP